MPEPAVDDDAIAERAFATTRKGFDPAEVRAFLTSVATRVTDADARVADLTARLADAEARVAELEEEVVTASARAEDVLAEAEEARQRIEAEGQREAERLVAEAEGARTRVLRDLRRRRKKARMQVEQLQAARERLLAALSDVRRVADVAAADLRDALPEARAAADAAARRVAAEEEVTVEQLEREIEVLRLAGLSLAAPVAPVASVPATAPAPERRASEAVRIVRPLRSPEPEPLQPLEAPDPDETVRLVTVEDLAEVVPVEEVEDVSEPASTESVAEEPEPFSSEPIEGLESTVGAAPEVATQGPAAAVEADPEPGSEPVAEPASAESVAKELAAGAMSEWASSELVAEGPVPAVEATPGQASAEPAARGPASAVGAAFEPMLTEPEAEPAVGAAPKGASTEPGAEDPVAEVEAARAPSDPISEPPVPAVGAAPEEPEPPAAEPAATEPAAERPAPQAVDALFARLKASRAERVAAAEAVLAEPEPEPEPEAEPDVHVHRGGGASRADLLARRDEAIAPAVATLARQVKRLLADDQNEVLDELRRRGTGDALGDPAARHARWAAETAVDLVAAAAAGVTYLNGTAGPGPELTPGDLIGVAESFAEQFVGPLHQRLAQVLTTNEDDAETAGDIVRSVYRTWRMERLGPAVEDAVLDAFAAGIAGRCDPGTPVCWVVDDGGVPCPDAEDNALAGGVGCGQAFPTGHARPPAHPGCRCVLVPVSATGTGAD